MGPSNPDEPLQSAGPATDRGYLSAAGFVLRQAQSSPLGGAKANHYSAQPDSFPPARSCDQHHHPPAPNCYKRNPLRHQQEAVTAPRLVQPPVVADHHSPLRCRCPLCEVTVWTSCAACGPRSWRWASPASKNLMIWIVPHENISTILTPWFSLICSSWPGAANPRRNACEYSFLRRAGHWLWLISTAR